MKKFLCLLLFVQSSFLFSQQLEKVLPLNFKNTNDLFQVVEEDKKQVLLFFRDKNRVLTVKFNDKFEVLDSISSSRPPKNYDDIIGYSITNNKYYSYWSTPNNKEITTQCFDFDTKKVSLTCSAACFTRSSVLRRLGSRNGRSAAFSKVCNESKAAGLPS